MSSSDGSVEITKSPRRLTSCDCAASALGRHPGNWVEIALNATRHAGGKKGSEHLLLEESGFRASRRRDTLGVVDARAVDNRVDGVGDEVIFRRRLKQVVVRGREPLSR